MPLETKIGQLLMASLDGPSLDAPALDFLRDCRIGSVIHFGNNITGRKQTTAYNAAIVEAIGAITGLPALIGIDHEGGRVMRFQHGATAFPSAMAVSAAGDISRAEKIGAAMADELRAMGFHIDFAPVLDVQAGTGNTVIGTRSYGGPDHAARFGAAMVRGMAAHGLIACGKHFPGHGDTQVDSHFGLPCVDRPLAALEQAELIPFAAAIEAGMPAVMTSHILFPQIEPEPLPATMSPRILGSLLRERLGFEGLIVSDGMHMQAITKEYGITEGCVAAIRAGVDLLCVGTAGAGLYPSQRACYQALLDAALDGALPMVRIDDAVRRVLSAKARAQAALHTLPDWQANAALAEDTADASVTLLAEAMPHLIGQVLCISREPVTATSGVAQGDQKGASVAEIAAEALGCNALILPVSPEAIMAADSIVLFLERGDVMELACLEAARKTAKPFAAVIAGAPQLARYIPAGVPTLCVYGAVAASIRAACKALRGDIPPQGRLPISLPPCPG